MFATISDNIDIWNLPMDSNSGKETGEMQRLTQDSAPDYFPSLDAAGKALEARIKLEAKKIREKYLEPPTTTDFAIMFLPIEGLYAEVLRRPGWADILRRDLNVVLAVPETLVAF